MRARYGWMLALPRWKSGDTEWDRHTGSEAGFSTTGRGWIKRLCAFERRDGGAMNSSVEAS